MSPTRFIVSPAGRRGATSQLRVMALSLWVLLFGSGCPLELPGGGFLPPEGGPASGAAPTLSLQKLEFGDLYPTPETTDPHRLGVRIDWIPAPTTETIWGHEIQRWNSFTGVWIPYEWTWFFLHPHNYWEDSELRGAQAFRVRTTYVRISADGSGWPVIEWANSAWSTTELVTIAPREDLKVILGWDWDLDGTLEGEDIEIALGACAPGCNLLLVPGTYENVNIELGDFPEGIAIYGAGRGVTILRSRVFQSNPWEPVLLLGEHDFPGHDFPGPIFQDFTIQGQRDEQPFTGYIDSDARGGLITAMHSGNYVNDGGLIQYIGVEDIIGIGIGITRARNWTVRHNVIENIGCYMRADQAEAPTALRCGEALVEATGMPLCSGENPDTPCKWSDGLDWPSDDGMRDAEHSNLSAESTTPGVKATGFGILVGRFSDDALIEDNYVTATSKIALEALVAVSVIFRRNVAEYSRAGIVMNGDARLITFSENIARYNGLPGLEDETLGDGFACGSGRDAIWEGNISHSNARAGFALNCSGGVPGGNTHLLRTSQGAPNVALANCLTTTQQTADVRVGAGSPSSTPPSATQNIVIDGLIVEGGNCKYALTVGPSSDVTVSDVNLQSGTTAVFNLDRVNALDANATSSVSGATVWVAEGDTAEEVVYFDVGGAFMHDMAVIDIAYDERHLGTFTQPFKFSDGTYANGDQNISYCPENPTLPGCPDEP